MKKQFLLIMALIVAGTSISFAQPGQRRTVEERVKMVHEKIDSAFKPDATVILKPFGYTKEMDELMTASDLVLGKPGGLTTSEAMAKGLVFVIVNPIPGQEERNSDHLLEGAAAIRCNNLPALSYKLERLLSDPERFKSMQANALRMGHPNAARDIVEQLAPQKAAKSTKKAD